MGEEIVAIMLRVALIFLAATFVLLGGLWVVIPILHGLAWIPPRRLAVRGRPSRRQRIYRALELAQVRPGETVYDLGAGDGRVLVIAARDFGAQAVGIEIEPVHCAVAWLRAL